MMRAAAALLSLMVCGCASTADPAGYSGLLQRGRGDLHCHDVHLSEYGVGGWRVRGCGRYQSYTCHGRVCVPADEGGVDERSRAEGIANDEDTATILDRVGPALAACAPRVEIIAIEVHIDGAGHITGGGAEDLDEAEGACVRQVLEPLTLPARGHSHVVELVVAQSR